MVDSGWWFCFGLDGSDGGRVVGSRVTSDLLDVRDRRRNGIRIMNGRLEEIRSTTTSNISTDKDSSRFNFGTWISFPFVDRLRVQQPSSGPGGACFGHVSARKYRLGQIFTGWRTPNRNVNNMQRLDRSDTDITAEILLDGFDTDTNWTENSMMDSDAGLPMAFWITNPLSTST